MEQAPNTPRGKEYQRVLHLADRRKRVNARDMEGNPLLQPPGDAEEYGSEAHEVLRAVQRELSSRESFISVSLTGSYTRGHSNDKSDIDITVLFDGTKGQREGDLLVKIYRDEMKKLEERGILKHHVHEIFMGITPQLVERILNQPQIEKTESDGTTPTQLELLQGGIVALCGLAVGPRVEEYRHIIRDCLQDMPLDRMTSVLQGLAVAAMQFEDNSAAKRQERVPILKSRNQEKARVARIGMWYVRIGTVLGVMKKVRTV